MRIENAKSINFIEMLKEIGYTYNIKHYSHIKCHAFKNVGEKIGNNVMIDKRFGFHTVLLL